MKKYYFFLIIFFLGINCFSKKTIKNEKIIKGGENQTVSSYIPQTKNKIVNIRGKVEIYPQKNNTIEIYIVEKWELKSRVSFKVLNYDALLSLKNKIVTVKAELIKMTSPWTGTIKLLKVTKVEEGTK